MNKILSAMCVATMFGVSAGVAAFAGPMAEDQMGKKDMMKDGHMTVSGCVAAGRDEGHYMLTNAMMMGGMMDKGMMDKSKMDKDHMAKPAMGGEHMMSYELIGGDLKAHVGHKVEVMGTMSKMDMEKMGKMGKMDQMAKDKMMADKDMKPMALTVTSVKMVSATCP